MATGNSTDTGAGRPSGAGVLKLAAIVWAVVLTWWWAIPADPGFSFDDREAIQGNPVVEGLVPAAEAFQRDYWHHFQDAGHYRPLATLLLRFDHPGPVDGGAPLAQREAEPDPKRFRRTNVVLHGLIVLTLGLALLRLDRAGWLVFPWFGLAVFGLHPAAADAVAWISGRTSLVSGLGAALMVLGIGWFGTAREASVPRWLGIAAASFLGPFTALMGKEDGVVLALVAAPFAWVLARGGSRSRVWTQTAAAALGAACALGLAAWLRHMALGEALPSSPAAPLREAPWVERLALGIAAWSQGVYAAWMPWTATPPSLEVSDLVHGDGPAGWTGALFFGLGVSGTGLAGVLAALGLGLWILRGQPLASLSLVSMCVAALPLVQIVPAGELFAPRFLYQPLLLGIPAMHAIMERVTGGEYGRALRPLVVLVLGCLSVLSIHRAAPVFASRTSYWEAHLPAHEDVAKVWNALGECAREQGDLPEARRLFHKAHQMDPAYSRPISSLGALALRAGDLVEARKWLTLAMVEGPNAAAPRGNLGALSLREKRPGEAEVLYRDAIRISPGRATFHRGLSRALLAQGRAREARAALDQAIQLDPKSPLNRSLDLSIEQAIAESPTGSEP